MAAVWACLIGYALGNISNAYLIGKVFLKKDVRKFGSGNAGATNAIRAFGAKVGIVVFIMDVLKGVLAVYFGRLIHPEIGHFLAGMFAIVGHNWPIILGFKGGKGIATSIGVMLMINPTVAMIGFVIGFGFAFFTRTVSLGSIIGVSIAPLIVIFIRPIDIRLLIFTLVLSALAIYRHRSNIVRLLKGQENKL